MLAVGGKPRSPGTGPVLERVGYWTDRGSYYYGTPENDSTSMEATLLGVRDAWDASSVLPPLGYLQLDDWWFEQKNGDFGGMVDWRGCAANCSPTGPA